MFSRDNLKKLAEQAQKAGTRLATNAGGSTNQWFAGQGSPERTAGDVLEGISELPPEQAVVKLQRQNARLRRKAEAAMALEQENASLKAQLQDLATQMATKVAAEMAVEREAKLSASADDDPEKAVHLLEAKIEMLRGNLTTARQELDEAAGLRHEVDRLHLQLRAAGIEPESASDTVPLPAAPSSRSPTQPADVSTHSDATNQQQPSSAGQVSPSQVSPFQSAAMQESGLSWMQSPVQSVEGLHSEGLQSGLQSPEPSALFSASAVTQMQQQVAALKAELTQLTQREAAEEADMAGLQTQNRELIGEVEKLRGQVGEAQHKLADSKVAASTAEKLRKQLEAQLEHAQADKANLEAQRSETQHSHEEELQSLRHTMQLISEQMRSAQTEFDSTLLTAAADLGSMKADSEQKTEELARQLGQSDFALRQLRAQLESATPAQAQTQDSTKQQKLEEQISNLTDELAVVKTQHESAVADHDSKHEHVLVQSNQLQEQAISLQDQLEAAKEQFEQSEAKAGRLKTALQTKSKAADEKQTQLETQLSELQQQLKSQSSQSEANAVTDALEIEKQSSKAENDELQQQVMDLKTELDQSRQQIQQAKDTLSTERHEHQARQQALASSQQLPVAATADQQQLTSQVTDLQLQLEGSAAQHADLQTALRAAEDKLAGSEADLANAQSQVGGLQQQLEEAQQSVETSHTAHQQIADQLREAVNDKAMLEQQLEAVSFHGQAEANGTGDKPTLVSGSQKQGEEQSGLLLAGAGSAAPRASNGSSDAELAGADLLGLVEDLAPDHPPAEDMSGSKEDAESQLAEAFASRKVAESQMQDALTGRTDLEGQLAEALVGQKRLKAQLADAEKAHAEAERQVKDSLASKHKLEELLTAAQKGQADMNQQLMDATASKEDLQQQLADAQAGQIQASQQVKDHSASKGDLERRLQDALTAQADALQQLEDSKASKNALEEQLERQAEPSDSGKQLEDALERQAELEQQLQAVHQQHSKTRQQLTDLGKLEQQLKDAQASQSQAEQQRADAVASRSKSEQRLREAQEGQSQAEQQLEDAKAGQGDRQQELAALQGQEAGWQEDRQSLNADLDMAKQQLVELQSQQVKWQKEQQSLVAEQDELKQRLSALQGQESSWQEERQSLRERCERLQKSNQQRRTQLQEAQQAAAEADKVRSQLAASESQVSSLKAEATRTEGLAGEHEKLRQALQEAEEGKKAQVQQGRREQALLERQLQAAGRDRDQLAEQVAMLSPVAATNEALHAQLNDLRKDLSQAQAGAALLPQEAARADEAQTSCRQLESEAASRANQLSRLEDKLHNTEQKLQEAQDICSDIKQAHAELARSYQDEMEGLASKAPSAWPSHVRQLVESRERAAASSAEAAAHAEAEAAEAEFEAETERLREVAAECTSKQQHAQAQMTAAQSRVAAIGVELEQRESSLRQQLQSHQAASAAETSKLSAEVARLTHELDLNMAQGRSEASEWQEKWQQAVKELADVKERAWSLLEEKDLQLQALKAGRPPSAGRSVPSRASSHASFSRRTSASGATGPLPAASQSEISDIQPARTVSEDSDSEGATLYQPIEFREHVQGAKSGGSASPEQSGRQIRPSAAGPVQSASDDLAEVKKRVAMLERELADSERTHQLRDKAAEVLKEEVAMLHRSDARGSVNVDYVKNVLLNGFESGELANDSSMVPVLARLLHFSPAETQRIKQAKPSAMKRSLSRTFLTKLSKY